jgi:opacity protein-like surface antigen
VKISGSGSTYRFESTLDTQLFTVSAKAGLPLGPVRIYGRAGANYLQATTTTTQTNDETSVTVDEETQAIPGGTITSAVESKGWSWTVGGGMEVWVSSWLGVYGDAGRAAVKGNVVDAEGRIDDRITAFTFGARIRIGGW